MGPEFIAYAVPETGDDLFSEMMRYYWQFTLSDRVISEDFAARFKDGLMNGARSLRHIPEGGMRAAVLWFRLLYGELDG